VELNQPILLHRIVVTVMHRHKHFIFYILNHGFSNLFVCYT